MSRLKIVQIVRSPAGGIRKHIVSIMESLKDFEFLLITDEKLADEAYREFKKNNKNINILTLNINDKPSFYDLFNIIKIYYYLYKADIHIIHGHGAKGGLYARLCGWLLGYKVVYTAHGGSVHSMHGKFKNIVYIIIEKILYSFTDKLVFESKYSLNEYSRKIYPENENFLLNYNGVKKQTDNYSHKKIERDRDIIIGAFGLLRYIKGHDRIIKAAKKLIDKNFRIKLRIFGDGEEKANLKKLASDLGISDSVKIYSETKNIKAEMRECHLIVHPSRFESFGYVPVEAMSLGVPCISSQIGGLVEIYEEQSEIYKLHNEDDLSKKIENLITSENELTFILPEKFTEEKFLEGIRKIYLSL